MTENEQVLLESPKPATEKQKLALAQAFTNDDLRGYIIHAIQIANMNALRAMKGRQLELAHDYSIRADALETFLNTCKLHFMHYDKIQKKGLSTGDTGN